MSHSDGYSMMSASASRSDSRSGSGGGRSGGSGGSGSGSYPPTATIMQHHPHGGNQYQHQEEQYQHVHQQQQQQQHHDGQYNYGTVDGGGGNGGGGYFGDQQKQHYLHHQNQQNFNLQQQQAVGQYHHQYSSTGTSSGAGGQQQQNHQPPHNIHTDILTSPYPPSQQQQQQQQHEHRPQFHANPHGGHHHHHHQHHEDSAYSAHVPPPSNINTNANANHSSAHHNPLAGQYAPLPDQVGGTLAYGASNGNGGNNANARGSNNNDIIAASEAVHDAVMHALELGPAAPAASGNNADNTENDPAGVADAGRGRGRSSSSSSTYERRRAARKLLRSLNGLEESLVGWVGANGSEMERQPRQQQSEIDRQQEEGEKEEHGRVGENSNDNDDEDDGKEDEVEVAQNDNTKSSNGGVDDGGDSFDNRATEQLISDLMLIPTEVRGVLLDGNEDDGSGIFSLSGESDLVACRIIMRFIMKSSVQQQLSSSSSFLPKWEHVDALLGRALVVCQPSSRGSGSGNTFQPYDKITASILAVINCICRAYAAQDRPIDITVLDSFHISKYVARRGMVDFANSSDAVDLSHRVAAGITKEGDHQEAVLQLRKLIAFLLGHLLQCLSSNHSNVVPGDASNGATKNLLDALIAEPQHMNEHQDDVVTKEDVEDYVDLLSEYCTELIECSLDLLDQCTSLVKPITAGGTTDSRRGRDGIQGPSDHVVKINEVHADSLRETVRSISVAVATFSTLRQLNIHPDPSTLRAFVVNLADFVAVPCNELMQTARKPLRNGGAAHDIALDMQNSIDASDEQLLRLCRLVMPGSAPGGRQRGGNKAKTKLDAEQKRARYIAIVSALSQSQHGGASDDLSSLLDGFVKHNDAVTASTVHRQTGKKSGRQHGPKRQRRNVSFQDGATDQNRGDGNNCGDKSAKEMKTKKVIVLKKANATDTNLVNACLLSSLLVPEYPSLEPTSNAFEESYKTAAAVAQSMYVGNESGRGLVDPTNPWHALISRKIVDTVTTRDTNGIGRAGGATVEARNILLRHAAACHNTAE